MRRHADIAAVLAGCNQATRARNPHLFMSAGSIVAPQAEAQPRATIIRQRQGDGMNKTERGFQAYMDGRGTAVRREPITFRLGNGVKYTPDFGRWEPTGSGSQRRLICYETKGAKIWDDATVKIKVAANEYPDVTFVLVQRTKEPMHAGAAAWRWQTILPESLADQKR